MKQQQLKDYRSELACIGKTVKAYAGIFSSVAATQVYVNAQAAKMNMGVLLKNMGEENPYKADIQNIADIGHEADSTGIVLSFDNLDAFVKYVNGRREMLKDIHGNITVPSDWEAHIAGLSASMYIMQTRHWLGMVLADVKEYGAIKEVQERYNSPKTNNMNFGQAIEALKQGKSVARHNWNGKAMVLYLKKGSFDGSCLGFKPNESIPSDHRSFMEGIPLGLFENGDEGTLTRLPNIQMLNANGNIVDGWLASQTDMLAEDWEVTSHEIWEEVTISDEGTVTGNCMGQPVSGDLASVIDESPIEYPAMPEFIDMCERANAIKEELGN